MNGQHAGDRFAERLLSGVAGGAGLLLGLYSAYLALSRVPRFVDVFRDFQAKLPLLTLWLIRVPWVVPVGPLLAMVCGGVGLITGNRAAVVIAWVLVLVSAGVILLAEIALQLPMQELIWSINRG